MLARVTRRGVERFAAVLGELAMLRADDAPRSRDLVALNDGGHIPSVGAAPYAGRTGPAALVIGFPKI